MNKNNRIKYGFVVKTGNHYRTSDFGYTKNIHKALIWKHQNPICYGKEKVVKIRQIIKIEEVL